MITSERSDTQAMQNSVQIWKFVLTVLLLACGLVVGYTRNGDRIDALERQTSDLADVRLRLTHIDDELAHITKRLDTRSERW